MLIELIQLWLPTVAAFVAGIVNAIAGGGSFLTFPALVFAGVPPVTANASSTVALFPSAFASAWAYREDFRRFEGVPVWAALAVSIAGGATGALLLLYLSEDSFDAVIPWLLLVATIMFAFGPRIARAMHRHVRSRPGVFLATQFGVAIYGGYFGGAVGLIMLAVWSLFGVSDIRRLNANKTLLGGSMNGAAVLLFILAERVVWEQTLTMLAAAVVGGYGAARWARRIDPAYLRALIIAISTGVTVAFFVRNG